jgi:CRP-like cAMP-binding protein
MESAKRWETEAMRESRVRRRGRPAVSQERDSSPARGEWRTLREASELTGIPISTLRKWCRRDTVDSFLESDGELTLRMVEMQSVRQRAKSLHRTGIGEVTSQEEIARRQTPVASQAENAGRRSPVAGQEEPAAASEPATMIVPVDAWNKMLNQLGNLHEAGQQLAEARERAAKAETEAVFLRERLAEMRETSDSSPSSQIPPPEGEVPPQGGGGGQTSNTDLPRSNSSGGAADGGGQTPTAPATSSESAAETAPFWRYVVRGWRGRRR